MEEKKESKLKKAAGAAGSWIKAHKVIAVIILAVLLALIGLFIFLRARSARQESTAETETVTVERRDLVQSLTLSGTVESGAAYSVTSALTDVEVKQVNVKVGDSVKEGDVIAVLDDTELRENVNSASRNLSQTKKRNSQDISNAKRSLNNAKEDRTIQTERAEAEADEAAAKYNEAAKQVASLNNDLAAARSDLSSAEINKNRAEAAAANADAHIADLQKDIDACTKRIEELQEEILSPVPESDVPSLRQQLEAKWTEKYGLEDDLKKYKARSDIAPLLKAESDAQAAYAAAQSKVSSLEDKVKTAEENAATLKDASEKASEASEDTDRNTARTVQDQKQALNSAYDSANDNLEAPTKELKKAKKDLDESIVVAESDGIVTAVNVKPGDKYKGDALAVIQDDSTYRVSASADQYDISSLAVGQEADITVTAADMTDTPGRLIYVGSTPMVSESGAVDSSGGSSAGGSSGGSGASYRVETVIQEPSDRMRIGMTAKVVVTVWKKADCLAVPDEAIRTDENGENYIVVVDDKGKQRNVYVQYGMKTDYYSEIIGDDVEEGMQVLVPQYGDDDGASDEDVIDN